MNCSFLRLSLLVSYLDVTFDNCSSPALPSERSEVLPDPSILFRSESSPDPSKSPRSWWSGWINVCSPSYIGSGWVTFTAPASAFCLSLPSRFFSLPSFILFTKRSLRFSLVASLTRNPEVLLTEGWLCQGSNIRVLPVLS